MKKNEQKIHMPSFATLRSFECAARHESFTLASEELHLTQSAISRQIKELEAITGIILFRRVGRRVVLTDAGRVLAKDISVDLERVYETVSRAVLAGNERSVLKVAALPTLADRWLIPRLPRFINQNPDIKISMSTRLEPFDLNKERFDMAIHFGAADWPDTKMVKLFTEKLFAVASVAFKNQHNINDEITINEVPLLNLNSRPNDWSDWFSNIGTNIGHINYAMQFDQFSMITAAANASLGAALLPSYLIEKELANRDLVCLSKTPLLTENKYFVVTPSGNENPQVNKFIQWIKSEIASGLAFPMAEQDATL